MRHPLDVLLDELRESAEPPAQAALYHLSSLEAKDVARVRETWPYLPVELRRQLITRLMELAEVDFEVDFGTIFRLGLEDKDAKVRTAAIKGLWEDEDVRLVPLLVARLREDRAVTVQAAAASSLGRFILMGELEKMRPELHTMAYKALLATCQDADVHTEVQRRALESLAYVSNETVSELIHEAYAAPEEKMRISAIFAMGRSADTRWAHHVRQQLFSPNPELRYEATRACGEIQLREATPELGELADDIDQEVREAALWALGQIGGDKAREILEHYCLAENEATRAAAESALDELEFLYGDLSEFFTRLAKEPNW
ncbi:MAG: HEAT repeat domain-containing protein [Chloroflexota bacterium]|nr:HEAT repeat domain-containing protein [Chloroflexota bacterium]